MSTKVNTEAPVPGMVPPLNRLVQIPGLKWLLLLVPLVYTVILLYYSMASVLKLSVYDDKGFTMQYLQQVFTEPLYLRVLWNTLKTSFIVMLVTLFISYPIAYLLVVMESERWKKIVLSLVMITLWISLLVRTFTWTVILQDQGIINKFLISAGIISQPLELMYNTTGVVIGMTHILIPYMVLSLYSVMEGIDRRLVQAAQGMGARPWKAFMQIFLPLSLPGVMSGSLIVFVLGIGYFITPALLGGQGNMMISKLIQENIQMTLNWSMASAISVVLLVTTLILLGVAAWVARLSPLLKGEK